MTRHLTQAAALLSAMLVPCLPASAAETRIEGSAAPFEAQAVRDLIPVLDAWISLNSDYPETDRPLARVVFVEPGFEVLHDGQRTTLGNTTRGVYVDDDASIYLVRPWYGDTAFDQSVLLHELVHHRQKDARHWYCEAAQEWDAYKLQEEYLAALDTPSGFHWASILLDSSCAVRDHHPD